jgi:hypothetical protein
VLRQLEHRIIDRSGFVRCPRVRRDVDHEGCLACPWFLGFGEEGPIRTIACHALYVPPEDAAG